MMQSHRETTPREGIVHLLQGAMADLAPVSNIMNKLELMYGTI